ncbi:MAG: single-stranded-DNA-specific exonuclease RecJ [Pseudomonadota bacterium]|nr:single-stranded-DNA-specific exonuclease RecJ [Pseudomonadota bacterium]
MPSDFLNVEKSASGFKWIGPTEEEDRKALSLSQTFGLSNLTALLITKRKINFELVQDFLDPKLKSLMPDPYTLSGMEAAAKRIICALHSRESICVFADYDVDGTVSASMLKIWFKTFDIVPEIYIPDRITEGYGPNRKAMTEISKKHKVIICVDCGTVSHEAIEIATKAGADVLVIDHHQTTNQLPPALAVVNPKRNDDQSNLDYLCAAGVVFLLLVAVNRLLKLEKQNPPDLISLLDLVALATVADVVPLIDLNRAIVRQGLKVFAKRKRPGLTALGDLAGISEKPNCYHLGFLIGPRINAAGRLSDAKLAVRLLTTNDPDEASELASTLNNLNNERKKIEGEVLGEAIVQLQSRSDLKKLVWAASTDWHQGVIGIIASRLKERYDKLALVFSINAEGVAIGSARSTKEIDIGKIVSELLQDNKIVSGGGHAMAAGLKIESKSIEKIMNEVDKKLLDGRDANTPSKLLSIDGLLSTKGATINLVEEINNVGPFGANNPAPRIAIANCKIKYLKVLAEKHIKFVCQDGSGQNLEAIYFNGMNNKAGDLLLSNKSKSFHLCGHLDINEWGGYRRVVLQVSDLAMNENI